MVLFASVHPMLEPEHDDATSYSLTYCSTVVVVVVVPEHKCSVSVDLCHIASAAHLCGSVAVRNTPAARVKAINFGLLPFDDQADLVCALVCTLHVVALRVAFPNVCSSGSALLSVRVFRFFVCPRGWLAAVRRCLFCRVFAVPTHKCPAGEAACSRSSFARAEDARTFGVHVRRTRYAIWSCVCLCTKCFGSVRYLSTATTTRSATAPPPHTENECDAVFFVYKQCVQ